ncbi:type II toxin-antitoxin system VapC family toxin [Lysobacter sp. K5869]|uniref:type II toxin-antitoxin system VapC family toxin n=1 Tax=Lysobacter sp. K5869 TaxID=2820808 RepID=UPI001C060EEF|nr:type II toxin-antitoxin system VapC family toxin [Lysobacter sp. K5869]QWP77435.1 type II toxin-antitoxin system VapC family toxin [Lysobacter sp. K5869]
MTSYFLADTSSLVYAYRAGGPQLLDTYRKLARAGEYEFAITKTVETEIENGPLRHELGRYIAERNIKILATPETELQLNAATDPLEHARLSKNAGERSLIEIAASEQAQGRNTVIWSDDRHFASPQIRRQLQRDLPSLETKTTAELLDQSHRDEFITQAEYQQHVKSYLTNKDFQDSPRLRAFDPTLSGLPELAEGEASLRAPPGQRGAASMQLLIGEVPRNTLIRSGGLLTTGADLAVSAQRAAELLEQDNPTAARSEATHAAARNLGGWVGGASAASLVGTSGYVPVAVVMADAMLMSKAFDKAVELKENRDITHQTDKQGVAWAFDGNNWVRDGLIDKTADGRDNPVEAPLGAGYEKARELGAHASVVAVELALGKAPKPQDPFDVPASPDDRWGLDNQNWRRNPETEQWQRQVKTGVTGANDRGVYEQQTASPERAMELNREAVARIERNIAGGRETVAAVYLENYAAQRSRDFVPVPAAVQAALPKSDQLTGSDGLVYRRDEHGDWASGKHIAVDNLALELELTRTAREPSLERLHARVAELDARPAPSAEQRQQNELLHQYRITGEKTELTPQWQEAIQLAVQRTRDAHGIDGPGALQLQRSHGAYGADSPIAHYQRGADGVNRLVAVTSTDDILQAREEVLGKDRQRTPVPDAAQPNPSGHAEPRAATRPDVAEPTVDPSHFSRNDQAMMTKIRAHVPDSVTDEQVAAAMLAAKRNGIADADSLRPVGVANGTLWMDRAVPGFHTGVDLAQPAPSMQDTLRGAQQFDQQQAQKQAQEREVEQQRQGERQAGAARAQS